MPVGGAKSAPIFPPPLCADTKTDRGQPSRQAEEGMAEVKWQSVFETGIDRIDEQHRELLGIMNRLDRSLQSGDSEDIIEVTLRSLISYTERHFATEEEYMRESGYFELARHQVLHHQIRMQVTGMLNRTGEPFQATADEILSLLADWLLNHIVTEDRKIIQAAKVSLR
jgi:hemerythrin-like metal-binding protein